MAEHNARLAELQGARELEKGAREEGKFRREARQFQGSQRAALAASGAAMSGSPLAVLADTAQGIEEDATTLRFNTLQNKHGFDVNAVNFRNQASAARASAKNARMGGWIGGAASLLGTYSQVMGMKQGVPAGASVTRGGISLKGQDWYRNKELGYGGYAF